MAGSTPTMTVADRWEAIARRLRAVAAALLALPLAAAAQPAPREPPQAPILRVEAGAHTAPVARLATDAAGRLLATVSDDKTLRLWNLPDGSPRAVLRPPIGPESEGELHAVALSADGTRAFVAGHTGGAWEGGFAILVFDTQTGRLTQRLPGLPSPVLHLALSADGARLAAGLGGRAGIRAWDARTGRLVLEDSGYAGAVRMLAFDPLGRLVAAGADGRVRVYDPSGRKLAERAPLPGARPYGVAISPDGTLAAIGYEDRLRVELLTLPDLRTAFLPDTTGLAGEGLPAVAWASDGRGGVQLYAAGYARSPGGAFVLRRWADFGLGTSADLPAARDAIGHLLPLPGGGLAYAAADPGWGRVAPDGALAFAPAPATADLRRTGATLAIDAGGQRLRVAAREGAAPLGFDAAAGLGPAGEGAWSSARPGSARLPLADWRDTTRPRLGPVALRLNEGEFSRSATVLAGDAAVVLGTDTHLRVFDPRGRAIAALPLPGAAWGVTATPDGGTLAAALGDGTLRWYAWDGATLSERAALFVHADQRRWVLWTPEGLFDHAPEGGAELVGVHLNGGRAQTPEWASFRQAYRALYAPAEVRARLAGDPRPAAARLAALGDLRARIGRLPVLRPTEACAVLADAAGCAPLPAEGGRVTVPAEAVALRLGYAATDRGLGIGPLDVLVNERMAARGTAGATVEVPLDPGPNRVATRLFAEDRTLFAEGPAFEVLRAGEKAPPEGAGRLIVLAVGVDRYANPALDLRFAVADARTVAETLRRAGGALFREVSVTLLTDREATRPRILLALAEIAARARTEDTFVLYLAGHGLRTEPDRRFLFLPHEVADTSSWTAVRAAALDDEALVAALARIRARDGFLFVDTCHAGQLTVDSLAALGNETGRFLLAASSSVQEALDSYDDRNGVFAFAVREGLTGRAAVDGEGRVSALALGEWVTRRVPTLAAEKQHRQDAVFRSAQRDLRSFPLAMVGR